MRYEQFVRGVGRAKVRPVYVLYGRDDLLVGSALKLVRKKVLGDAQAATNLTELEGEEAAPATLFDLLRTRDMFGSQGSHLVVMYNADRFAYAHRKAIERFNGGGAGAGALALLVAGPERGRRAVPAYLEKIGQLVDCRSPSPRQVPDLVRRMAAKLGKSLGARAAGLLIELAGRNLAQLHQQVQSLVELVGERSEITERDVMELVGGDFQRQVWDLLNAMNEGKTGEALGVIDRLLRQSHPEQVAPSVIGVLDFELRQLAHAKERLEAGEPAPRVQAAMIGPIPTRRHRLEEAKRISWQQFARRMRILAQADLQCKTSSLPVQTALETLVMRLSGAA